MFLRRHGLLATAIGGSDSSWGDLVRPRGGDFAVTLADSSQFQRAIELLDEMDAEPITPESGWEDHRPDLSRLDPDEVQAPCPACGEPLPLDERITACPACLADADPVEVLLALFGPEVLTPCCATDGPDMIDDRVATEADLPCPGCRYSLRLLAPSALCPECGLAYSKREMLGGPP